MTRVCAVTDCSVTHFCKGFCRKHFERFKRHGDPTVVLKALSPKGAPLDWIQGHCNHAGDGCLIWPFARFPDGRAHMNGAKPTRVMCELVHGPAPTPDHEAAHSCGRGYDACVNPNHLRWATPVENAADKFIHGTVIAGSEHYGAILDEEKVRSIRALSKTMMQKDIAKMFGVKHGCIHKVINRKTWRHVA